MGIEASTLRIEAMAGNQQLSRLREVVDWKLDQLTTEKLVSIVSGVDPEKGKTTMRIAAYLAGNRKVVLADESHPEKREVNMAIHVIGVDNSSGRTGVNSKSTYNTFVERNGVYVPIVSFSQLPDERQLKPGLPGRTADYLIDLIAA